MEVVLGLGSNLGDRLENLEQAIAMLIKLQIIEQVVRSTIYQSKALLKADSPSEWDLDYLNMAIKGTSKLSPRQLLEAIKKTEKSLGRQDGLHWSPRAIDIDILAYGGEVIIQDDLIIPHLELLNRVWALAPFVEVHPDWQYPVQGPYYQLAIKAIIKERYGNQTN
jgi:2-amino-4-hydroxy-6-hydroxymethyldihydropteridine diphosphokinase/dihydropteroate synthase